MNDDQMERASDLHAMGVSVSRIARELRLTVEEVEYLIDRHWTRWASQYGYDN